MSKTTKMQQSGVEFPYLVILAKNIKNKIMIFVSKGGTSYIYAGVAAREVIDTRWVPEFPITFFNPPTPKSIQQTVFIKHPPTPQCLTFLTGAP